MSNSKQGRAIVEHITFRLREAFPINDPISVPLLRLLAATNDSRQLQQLLIIVREDADLKKGPERLVANGELGYLIRVLCGHLHEAGSALRELWYNPKARNRINRILRETEDQGSSYATLRELYTDSSAHGIKYSLEEIRNYAAFHYPQGGFKRALETHAEEGELIIAQYSGLSRYVVTDSFATIKVLEVAGGTPERFQDLVGKVIDLVGALGTAMDHILVGVFKLRPTAIVGQESESVEIPKALERAREYVERLRAGEAHQ